MPGALEIVEVVEMKTLIYTVLFCFAIVPVYGQQPRENRRPDGAVGGEAAASSAQEYADRVEILLRDVRKSLQEISEQQAAGQLTAEQARVLKLEATRSMIARLETASAVYEARAGLDQVVSASNLSKQTTESASVGSGETPSRTEAVSGSGLKQRSAQ